MTPGSLLKEARTMAGLTQAELAERLGSSQPVVARLERRDANPRWETFVSALRAAGYGVEVRPLPAEPTVRLDLDQLRARLSLSPGERLRRFQASLESLQELRTTARRVS
jgi:transcriptional regulator with XRE-family HTH domain